MHIPDGYLGPYTYLAMWAIMIPIWYYAANRLGRELRSRQVPLLALAAAFSFVIMMFNIPIPGGSTGHAVGGAIVGIVLGALGGGNLPVCSTCHPGPDVRRRGHYSHHQPTASTWQW